MLEIKQDDLTGSQIQALLQEHLSDMHATSPAESVHALDLQALKSPSITFWTIWHEQTLAGCAALQKIDDSHLELKSMRSAKQFKNQGIASTMLKFLIAHAKQAGFEKISLETGSMDYFKPAHQLYKKHGFSHCPPFANYVKDINSIFMTLDLAVAN
ncbi:GNAT family N-acetyltransferase [Gammaproteobacteria bacterium AS21]|jgi:putative acetyltransferase